MLRYVVCALMIASPALAKAAAEKHEPNFPAVSQAEEACSAEGAFGRDFLRQHNGHTDTTVGESWAPFGKLSIGYDEIRAAASFHGSTASFEEDRALAKKFLKAFEKAAGEKPFADRKPHTNGVELYSSKDPGSGFAFLIRQDDDRVTATCRSLDR